jgi:sugar phosphate isomerase/epimerase
MMQRRTFLTSAPFAVAAPLAGSLSGLAAKPFQRPLGVQIYSARTILAKDPEGTLKRIAALGYQEVELFAADQIAKLGAIINGLGMRATSLHVAAQISLADDPTPFQKVLDEAKKAGIRWAGVPYVAPNDRGQGDFWKQYAAKLNRAGEIARKAGLGFFYHNHAFEFAGPKGQRAIDYFEKELSKDVKLELDVFWAAAAGEDVVDFLKSWKNRVGLLHVKDRAKGMAKISTEREAKATDFKEVGAGDLNFPAILTTALKTGVDRFFVEQDQTPGDPIDSLKQSIDFLKAINL